MGAAELKNKIQASLEGADMDLLERVKEVIDTYQDKDNASVLTDEQFEGLKKRRASYLKGEEATYSWQEIKQELINQNQ